MTNTDHQFTEQLSPYQGELSPPVGFRPENWGPTDHQDGFRFFGPLSREDLQSPSLERSLRVCVATSIRDIGCEDNANRIVQTPEGDIYMRGSLHALLDACKVELRGEVEVVGIVIDDVPNSRDLKRNSMEYSLLPEQGRNDWIVPGDYTLSDGRAISEITASIPSDYRKLPRATANDLIRRERQKCEFEAHLAAHAESIGADVILSDHLMIKLEHLFCEGQYSDRVVNIHPANILEDIENVRKTS
jgi:hypothetical protein